MSIANIVFADLVLQSGVQDPANHPDYLCANDQLVFSALCRNDGDRRTRSFHVTFRLDGTEEHSARVDGLDPGESQWVQWHHDAVEYGRHELYVEFDSRERIRESDENDNSATQYFDVYGAQTQGHTVEMAPEVVTADPADLGWQQIDVTFLVRDPRGHPIRGYNFFTEFYGPEQQTSYGGQTAGDSALDAAGLLQCPNVWLRPDGFVRMMGVATAGGPHEGGPMLEGLAAYRLAAGATTLVFEVRQEREEIEVTASSSEEASQKVAAEGHAGIEIEILSLGGSGSTEHGSTHTEGREYRYKVILGTPTLVVTQTH